MNNKVIIIGCGNVGMSFCYALLNQRTYVNELVLIDINTKRVEGEVMDLNHCLAYSPSKINIKQGNYNVIDNLIENNKVNVNLIDTVGNDVLMRLLKAKQYDLVIKLMKKKNWDVNHTNEEGDTFGHLLARDNSVGALKIVELLTKKKNYIPNIQNNRGETVLDKAINNNYLYTIFKILEDKRFDNIDVISFINLYKMCIKNTYYGKYSKLNNLEVIVDSLDKKELSPNLRNIINKISDNMEKIKQELMNNGYSMLDFIVGSALGEVEV